MSKYAVHCPNCGSTDIKMVDYGEWECECGEGFGVERAVIEKESEDK